MEDFRLNILASAYKCTPDKDSESEVGWQWVFNLGRYHRITVITRQHENSGTIRTLLAAAGSDVRFKYYELPRWLKFLEKGDIKHFIYYSLWQFGSFLMAKKLVSREIYDLVHHFVFVNTWQPTYMAFLPIPFYFGPIGENAPMPYGIIKQYGWIILLREKLGSLIKNLSKNFSPLMTAVYNRAVRIIVINNAVKKSLRLRVQEKCLIQPAVGIVQNKLISGRDHAAKEARFKVLYVGRYVYRKAPDIALMAFLKFAERHPEVDLIMIGGGKMSTVLSRMLSCHQQSPSVQILGWLDRNGVDEHMGSCDIFLFPTFEGGGAVVLEAMSFGKPVICLDFGGPAEFITDECGIKVKVTDRTQIIDDLADALKKLYVSDKLRCLMGLAAKKRIEQLYDWGAKVRWMNGLYGNSLPTYIKHNDTNNRFQKT